jgi:hypothetical protein
MKILNYLGNRFLTFMINFLFNLSLKDSQSGMWIIRKPALKQIHVVSPGMPFSQELKIEAFLHTKAKELPGRYKARFGETKLLKLKDGFGNFYHLLSKRFERKNA